LTPTANKNGAFGQIIPGVIENLLLLANFTIIVLLIVTGAFTREVTLLDLCKFFGGALVGQGLGQSDLATR
jgi:hypothetical protein